MIGADAVAKAAPDGYTVLFSTAAEISINQHLYRKMSYDPVKDLAPASYAAHAALLFSVHPSIPARSIKQWWSSPRRSRASSPTRRQAQAAFTIFPASC
jgi:tripartite-type tricarboxylate transporter receptor subunit TctC